MAAAAAEVDIVLDYLLGQNRRRRPSGLLTARLIAAAR